MSRRTTNARLFNCKAFPSQSVSAGLRFRNTQVEVSARVVTNKDGRIAGVERVPDLLSHALVELVDAGYVLRALSEVEENLALVVRRGSVIALNFWEQAATSDDVGDYEEKGMNTETIVSMRLPQLSMNRSRLPENTTRKITTKRRNSTE